MKIGEAALMELATVWVTAALLRTSAPEGRAEATPRERMPWLTTVLPPKVLALESTKVPAPDLTRETPAPLMMLLMVRLPLLAKAKSSEPPEVRVPPEKVAAPVASRPPEAIVRVVLAVCVTAKAPMVRELTVPVAAAVPTPMSTLSVAA